MLSQRRNQSVTRSLQSSWRHLHYYGQQLASVLIKKTKHGSQITRSMLKHGLVWTSAEQYTITTVARRRYVSRPPANHLHSYVTHQHCCVSLTPDCSCIRLAEVCTHASRSMTHAAVQPVLGISREPATMSDLWASPLHNRHESVRKALPRSSVCPLHSYLGLLMLQPEWEECRWEDKYD